MKEEKKCLRLAGEKKEEQEEEEEGKKGNVKRKEIHFVLNVTFINHS